MVEYQISLLESLGQMQPVHQLSVFLRMLRVLSAKMLVSLSKIENTCLPIGLQENTNVNKLLRVLNSSLLYLHVEKGNLSQH